MWSVCTYVAEISWAALLLKSEEVSCIIVLLVLHWDSIEDFTKHVAGN